MLAQHWQSVAAVKIGTRQETGVRVSPTTTRLLERSWIGLDLEIYGVFFLFFLLFSSFRPWAHNVVGTQAGVAADEANGKKQFVGVFWIRKPGPKLDRYAAQFEMLLLLQITRAASRETGFASSDGSDAPNA